VLPPTTSRRQLKQVVSASRRTELVAHYPDQLARRLLSVGPDTIHTAVLWTKDPSNLLHHQALRDALSGVDQVFLHWTVTGLGGTFLEPNVPSPEHQLAMIDAIVSYLGDPRRLHWRYDPLVTARCGATQVSNVDLDLFRAMAEPFARAGVPAVHTSFVTVYRKVERRLPAKGIQFQELDPAARRDFVRKLKAAAEGLGLSLLTCCEPGMPMQRCIDGALLAELHPTGEPCRLERARGQRQLCGCTTSLDVGQYLPCPNGCVYCYARPVS
jgi:hypothetical protein